MYNEHIEIALQIIWTSFKKKSFYFPVCLSDKKNLCISAAYVSIPTTYHPNATEVIDGFSMSGWFQAFANTDGYIFAKTNSDGSRQFYTLRLITNSLQAQLVFGYSVTGSNVSVAHILYHLTI